MYNRTPCSPGFGNDILVAGSAIVGGCAFDVSFGPGCVLVANASGGGGAM